MKRILSITSYIIIIFTTFTFFSCIDKICTDEDNGNSNSNNNNSTNNDVINSMYIYPFGQENRNITAEITIQTNGSIDLTNIETEIPALKYNKSWLFMLTQDDCKQCSFCSTWAAINGKPLSDQYYYDIRHLFADDLPPDVYYLGKTLGVNDGTGKEVRFAFTTTLAPELGWMHANTVINKGYTNNYYRFFMKSGLIWDNVIEMLNYGNGIAFHDVNANDVNNISDIYNHYIIAQDSIKKNLSDRGCKTLAEPNGNKNYVYAALNYNSIQTMTAQNGSVELIYPFNVTTDLNKVLLQRYFIEPEQIKTKILSELQKSKEQRQAIHIGVHGTDRNWSNLLLWLNDNYGKDGDNSIWMPSLEEYYEYNYYRIHGTITKTIINNNTIKITVQLPSDEYFYFPSITLNLKGITNSQIQSIVSNDAITGLSYGNYSEGVMFNIDCRKFLLQHATHYVEQYELNRNTSNKKDALYFTNQLKDSPKKIALLNRINGK